MSNENNLSKGDVYLVINGERVSIDSFRHFFFQDGKVYKMNKEKGFMIELNIDDKEQMELYKVEEVNIREIRYELERQKQQNNNIVPLEYSNKFCALFGGKVFHSFDTKEELQAFINGPTNRGLNYKFYYPNFN